MSGELERTYRAVSRTGELSMGENLQSSEQNWGGIGENIQGGEQHWRLY